MIDDDLEHELDDHIDLTPLIDAMFILLIFFILTTTFSKPVMDVMLPHAESSAKADSAREQVVLSIDSQGRIFHGDREVAQDELAGLLSSHAEMPVNLHVDAQAPFQAFIKALDESRMSKRDEIVISTDPAEK